MTSTSAIERIHWTSLVLGAAASLAGSVAIAAQAVTVGSVKGRWVYPYVREFSLPVLLPFVFGSGAIALLLHWTRRAFDEESAARVWAPLAAWILAATAFQAALRPFAPVSLEGALTSPGAHGFYTVAAEHGPRDVLRRFSRIQSQAPLHVQSNMPGKILVMHGLSAITTDTRLLPWLIVLLSNAGAVFMYLFVRDLFDDSTVAVFAAALYLFVPSRNFFLPLMNTITPVVVLAYAWLLIRWLRTRRVAYAAAFGIATYGLVFFEPLPLVIGLLFAALVLRAIARREISWTEVMAHAAVAVLTMVAVATAIELAFGFDMVAAFRRIAAHAAEFNREASRPYSVWVAANLWEFLLGAGVCQAFIFCGAAIAGLRGDAPWRDRLTGRIAAVCLGLAAVLLATDLIGVNRGETMRLWVFLACFFQIPAAYVCARLADPRVLPLVVCTSMLAIALGIGTIGFVMP